MIVFGALFYEGQSLTYSKLHMILFDIQWKYKTLLQAIILGLLNIWLILYDIIQNDLKHKKYTKAIKYTTY